MDSSGSEYGPVADSHECSDEPSASGAMKLVSSLCQNEPDIN
jgi:hypothetical protein